MSPADARRHVLAYYFPQYHSDPRNDRWHGKGWTEWDLVKAARPRYPGHRQPIEPAWGYFDESDPKWAAREINLAADHGITGFLYDWYWYEDGPFLEAGLERGFLRAPNSRRLQFALMWANHDWLNIHPATFVNRPETLAPGKLSRAGFERMTEHVAERYFTRPNYLRLEGRPYFSIYELHTFIEGLGGLEGARSALEQLRSRVRAAGDPGIHLNGVIWSLGPAAALTRLTEPELIAALGLDSLTTYAWVHHSDPGRAGFPKGSYAEAFKENRKFWEEARRRHAVPYYPNVSMGWDPSPRTIQSDRFENRGYPWTAVLEGSSPAAFREALIAAREFAESHRSGPSVVTINAWNEWTEGSYLLPDRRNGARYLQAVRSVFGAASQPARDRTS